MPVLLEANMPETVSLFAIKGDRLDTGQIVTHLVWRLLANDYQRCTIDLSGKHGSPTAGEPLVSGAGLTDPEHIGMVIHELAKEAKVILLR
mgnify:CR=1 FL=1